MEGLQRDQEQVTIQVEQDVVHFAPVVKFCPKVADNL
jgi:hypothetical protein